MYSWRSCLNNHGLAELILSNTVRADNNAIWLGHLCPRSCNLTMQKTGINTSKNNLKLAITNNSTRRNCTLRCCWSSRNISRCCLLWLKLFWLNLYAHTSFRVNLFCYLSRSIYAKTRAISCNKHWEVKASNSNPILFTLFLKNARNLVKGGATP